MSDENKIAPMIGHWDGKIWWQILVPSETLAAIRKNPFRPWRRSSGSSLDGLRYIEVPDPENFGWKKAEY